MKRYEMIMDDICRCASKECPKYNKCLRGNGYKGKLQGIYTISLLAQVCNENSNYEMFIKVEND